MLHSGKNFREVMDFTEITNKLNEIIDTTQELQTVHVYMTWNTS